MMLLNINFLPGSFSDLFLFSAGSSFRLSSAGCFSGSSDDPFNTLEIKAEL